MIIGQDGPAAVISAETAAFLEKYANLSRLRVLVRGARPRVGQELLDIREVALAHRPPQLPAGPEAEADIPEDATNSERLLDTVSAADLIGISDSAVRLACRQLRLGAHRVGGDTGPWRIPESAAKAYRASRSA